MRKLFLWCLFFAAAGSWGCGQASAAPSFTLGEHDKLVAEAQGCRVECRIVSPTQRTCVIQDSRCRAECLTIPECRPDGVAALRACAVLRDR